MLTVEMTSMPAASSSSMSCHRLELRHPGHVRVSELVDERDLRGTGQHRVEIHLLERLAPVLDDAARDDFEVTELGGGQCPTVGLEEPDDHVGTALLATPTLVEHGERLADAGGGADVDPQGASRHRDDFLQLMSSVCRAPG